MLVTMTFSIPRKKKSYIHTKKKILNISGSQARQLTILAIDTSKMTTVPQKQINIHIAKREQNTQKYSIIRHVTIQKHGAVNIIL